MTTNNDVRTGYYVTGNEIVMTVTGPGGAEGRVDAIDVPAWILSKLETLPAGTIVWVDDDVA